MSSADPPPRFGCLCPWPSSDPLGCSQAAGMGGLCEAVPLPPTPTLSGAAHNNIRRVYLQKATEGYISEKGASSLKKFIKLNCQLI